MKPTSYKSFLLVVLLLTFAFNAVDRLALGLLLQSIKVDLSLSDTQLGLLSGIAFSLFYSVLGIPIARAADRGDRVLIISVTTLLWSAAVALCGMAGNFAQLLLIRIGVAVGEAGCVPPAHSLIAENFTRAERPRAVSRYMLGSPISVVVGYFVGGWLNELYGWRMTFVLLGLPGLVLAALSWFTLREPRRATPVTRPREAASGSALSMWEVGAALWSNVTFRHLLLCFSVTSFFMYGIWKWQPAFFIRTHGLQTGELGTWLTVVFGLGGFLGTFIGGELATRLAENNERRQLRAVGALYGAFAVILGLVYLSPNPYWAFALLAVVAVGNAATAGPLYATLQTLVPDRMRAQSIAIVYLFSNLIGMGLGPLAVGAVSDLLRPVLGAESLRYALLLMCPGYFWGAWHLLRASRSVAGDLDQARTKLESATSAP